jgi:hypothetical protein
VWSPNDTDRWAWGQQPVDDRVRTAGQRVRGRSPRVHGVDELLELLDHFLLLRTLLGGFLDVGRLVEDGFGRKDR